MIFPLEQLVEYTGNVYEITCASIRRAFQLSMTRTLQSMKTVAR